MSRLQKKCLMASLFTHGTLLLVMLIGSAFITPQPKQIQPTIELVEIPDILIDENFAGGGNPAPAQPPPQQPVVQPPPVVEKTPPPQPKAEVKVPEPQPKPQVIKEPAPKPVEKPKPKPVEIKVNTKAVKMEVAANTPKPAPQPKINAEDLGKRLEQAIESQATGATAVSVPGAGGASYAPYAAYLKKVYETRWVPPQAASGNPVVQVEIVVAKNGKVISARITKRSGSAAMDRSIQTVLDQIRQLRPLPASTTDAQRTFNLQFNLN